MTITLKILSLVVITASILPLWKTGYWWVRALDFPRLQLMIAGLFCLVGMSLIDWNHGLDAVLVLGLLFATGLDIYRIFPYLPFTRKESHDCQRDTQVDRLFSFISANVLIANRQVEKLIQLVKVNQPDLLLLLEPDDWWEKSLQVLEKDYPHHVKIPQENTYGMLLYSRLPLQDVEIMHLVDERVPSIFTKVKLGSGDWVRFIALHPRPPRPKEGPSDERDAELMQTAKFAENKSEPIVVVGDLNDVAWSHTTRLFIRVSGMLDPRRGRGFYSTYPTKYPFFRFPLDHIFHTETLSLAALKRLTTIGSDHFPIFVRLALTEDNRNEANEKEDGDKQDVREMLAKGREWDGPNEKIDGEN
ncbi:MAG: endonuclease/exonuclease/phosphatase family protein [Oligoflexus sp.]